MNILLSAAIRAGMLATVAMVLIGCAGTAPQPTAPVPTPGARPASTPASTATTSSSAGAVAAAPGTPPIVVPVTPPTTARPATPATAPPPSTGPGGFYLDDGPHDKPPPNLDRVAEPEPVIEPLHRFANNPYVVFGQRYIPDRELKGATQRGTASWYGRRFHGNRTSNGEVYDMYQLTAAHPTLPLPSFARVTNLANGRAVVVRVNDRGPFLRGRVIDLSYAAAARLGYVANGHAEVEVQSLLPRELPRTPTPNLPTPGLPAPDLSTPRIPLPADEPLPGSREAAEAIARATPPAMSGLPTAGLSTAAGLPTAGLPTVHALTAVAKLPIVEEGGGLFVQLGAFRSPENAESVLARFIFQLTEFSERLRIVSTQGLHRVVAGPYRNRADALAAAARLGPLE